MTRIPIVVSVLRACWRAVYRYYHWGYVHRTPVSLVALTVFAAAVVCLVAWSAVRVVRAARARLSRHRTAASTASHAPVRSDARRRHLDAFRQASDAQISRRVLAFEGEFADLQEQVNALEANDKEGSR